MRILFLSRWFPSPPDNGSKLRVYNLLRGLGERHEVTLITFVDPGDVDPDPSELDAFCRRTTIVPWKPFEPRSRSARAALFALRPRSAVATYSAEMERRIREALVRHRFDLVIASQQDMAAYGQCFAGLPALLEEVELGVLHEQYAHARGWWPRLRYRLTWIKHRRYLGRLLRCFRACTVVSEAERRLLLAAVPRAPHVEIVPNCVRLEDYAHVRATPQRGQLIFTGSFRYQPNHDAMLWFLGEVFPRLVRRISGVRLVITGDHAGRPLPPADNVVLTGRVADVRPWIASSWASLAPIRTGGGTRLKILEAMSLGTPVIATSKGVEGIDARTGYHLLVADSPAEYAAAVAEVLENPTLRAALARRALDLVAEHYDWAVVLPRFLELAERVART